MKTMEDIYKDVMASEEQKNELSEAAKEKASLESFLKKYECDASADDFVTFLEEKFASNLNEDALDAVAGGAMHQVGASVRRKEGAHWYNFSKCIDAHYEISNNITGERSNKIFYNYSDADAANRKLNPGWYG